MHLFELQEENPQEGSEFLEFGISQSAIGFSPCCECILIQFHSFFPQVL